MPPDPLQPLRDALAVTPGNAVLRRLVADQLTDRGDAAEAIALLREGLHAAPRDRGLSEALVRAFHAAGKDSEAAVLLESLAGAADASPAFRMLAARVFLASGDPDRARGEYRRAVEGDASLADEDLARRLGVAPQPAAPPGGGGDEDDVDDEGRVRVRESGGSADGRLQVERPALTFADVGGLDALKDDLRMKVIHPLAKPELFRAYGKTVGGGLLLYGPPGCGKTYMARATAGEAKIAFLAVGLEDVLDMWFGNSEQKLHAVFQLARRSAPCLLFFDEVDALGGSRSDLRHSSGRNLVNMFLQEMDGAKHANDGVLVLAATNAPWHVDSAFRRPGRFDRTVFVPPPDDPGRADILRALLRGKPVADIDHAKAAAKCPGFSGADLSAVVAAAVEAKLREALRTGTPAPITTRDLIDAAKSVKPSTREWFATARNHALYANEGGLYDDVLRYLDLAR